MFDFAWSEIALIAVVAMIAIGPKDMPVAMRAVTGSPSSCWRSSRW